MNTKAGAERTIRVDTWSMRTRCDGGMDTYDEDPRGARSEGHSIGETKHRHRHIGHTKAGEAN